MKIEYVPVPPVTPNHNVVITLTEEEAMKLRRAIMTLKWDTLDSDLPFFEDLWGELPFSSPTAYDHAKLANT